MRNSNRLALERFCDTHMPWVRSIGWKHEFEVAKRIAKVAGVEISGYEYVEMSCARILAALERKLAAGESLDEIYDA